MLDRELQRDMAVLRSINILELTQSSFSCMSSDSGHSSESLIWCLF